MTVQRDFVRVIYNKMSYCLAWEKNNDIYIIADSCISNKSDDLVSKIDSFGEKQGLYGNYYVQEGLLKIYEIDSKSICCFAGDVKIGYEIIEHLYSVWHTCSVDQLLKSIAITYNGANIELIIAVSKSNGRNIYHFNGKSFQKVEKCEIGCGKEAYNFSQYVRSMIDSLYKDGIDKNYYLAMVLGFIQCYSIKYETIALGFGGTYAGVVVDSKVKWFRDLEYYMFDDDIKRGITISVISRRSSVFSSSDVDGVIRFIINKYTDKSMWDDLYYNHAIAKALNTKNAYYYIFYSKLYNVITFLEVNGKTQNIHFRRWVRRENNEIIHYAYAFSSDFTEIFKSQSNNDLIPEFIEVQVIEDKYMPHSDVTQLCNPNDINRLDFCEKMDFDFTSFEFKDFDISLMQTVKKSVEYYHNILLIDFKYFCDLINEIIETYKTIRLFTIDELDFERIASITGDQFSNLLIVVVKDKNDTIIIDNYNMEKYFHKFSNCIIMKSQNTSHDFCGMIFQLLKNFYLNDKFFHLNKIFIMADSKEANSILTRIIPEFNYCSTNPDILLIRNFNGFTKMDGRIKYDILDSCIMRMFNISMEEWGHFDSIIYDNGDISN